MSDSNNYAPENKSSITIEPAGTGNSSNGNNTSKKLFKETIATKEICPYCGGDVRISQNQGGFEIHKCSNCGYEVVVENENSLNKLYARSAFSSEVIRLLTEKVDGGKKARIKLWKDNEQKLREYKDQCGGEANEDPLYAIAYAAFLTDGFEEYTDRTEKLTVERLYNVSKDYLRKNSKAQNIKQMVTLYEEKLRHKGRGVKRFFKTITILLLLAIVATAAIIGFVYKPEFSAPIVGQEDQMVEIKIPSDAVQPWLKPFLESSVKLQTQGTPAHNSATNALSEVAEKFVVYDLQLSALGNQITQFNSKIEITLPIPEEFNTASLKIYYIYKDATGHDMYTLVTENPNVNAYDGTVSFEVDHFSWFAIVEKQPVVSFDSNGGSKVDSQVVNSGELVERPVDPTKVGYAFAGWVDSSTGKEWNFETNKVQKHDIKLEAKWKALLSFDANGGTGTMDSIQVSNNDRITLPDNAFVREGYVFKGWATSINGTVTYSNKSVYTHRGDEPATLYAIWAKAHTTVTFDANGGVGEMESMTYEAGSLISLNPNTFVRDGYTFKGWSTTPNGSASYEDRNNYKFAHENVTLYAVWEGNLNEVTFHSNGADGGWMGTLSFRTGEYQSLTLNDYYRYGYTFKGWSDSPNGPVKYTDGVQYFMPPHGEVLYAVWEANQNVITFNANGGTGTMESQIIQTNASANLNPNTFTRLGYTFIGWSTSSWSSWIDYTDGANYTMGTDSNVTLYAVWQQNTYTLVYHTNGGSSCSSREFTVDNLGFALETTTRSGYDFGGWYLSSEFEGDAVTEITLGNNLTIDLYARWIPYTYTITFDANGGELAETTMTVGYEQPYTLPVPTKTGYTFTGWYNGETRVSDGTWSEASDATLTAGWTAAVYNAVLNDISGTLDHIDVTFNPNYLGAVSNVVSLSNGEVLSYPEIPTRDGYAFAGWYLDADCTMPYDFTGTITANFTLYAAWSNVSITNDTYYPWEIVDGVLTSTNHSHSSTSSYTITAASPITISFTCWSDSEGSCDYLTIYLNGSYYTNAYGGNGTYDYSFSLNAGDYITFRYSKDGSVHSGADSAYISGLSFNHNVNAEGSTATASCGETTEYSYSEGSVANFSVTYGSEYTLPTPVRPGYVFGGWYEGETAVNMSGVWDRLSDMTLTARWSVTTYTLTLDANGGSVDNTSFSLSYGQELTLPTPTKTGYTFNGWFTADGTQITSGAWSYTSDVTAIASWSVTTNNITFNDSFFGATITYDYNYAGSTPTIVTVANGGILTYPEIPAREGYVFTGWYTDNSCTTRYTFSDTITSNLTLYAGWTAQYSSGALVNYNVNPTIYNADVPFSINTADSSSSYQIYIYLTANESGTHRIYFKNGSSSSSYRTYIGVYNLTTNNTIASSYRYSNTSYDYFSFDCNAGDVIVICAYRSNYSTDAYFYFEGFNSITSTAAVTANSYLSGSTHTQRVEYGSAYTLPTPIRPGYSFTGWFDANGNQVTDGTWNGNSDITLTAGWTPSSYTATFDANGGTVDTTTLSVTMGTEYTLPVPTRTGYTFSGWFTADGTQVTDGAWTISGDVTLTASWTVITNTITFDANGGTIDPATMTVTYGSAFILPIPTKTGNSFAGWFDANGIQVTDGVWERNTDITLTAAWTTQTNTITFDVNGGTLDVTSMTVTYGQAYTLPIPTKTGYTFGGWQMPDSTPVESGTWTGNTNLSLRASWTANTYTITFGNVLFDATVTYDYNYEGATPTTETVYNGYTLSYPSIPTRTGYLFTGWYTDRACTSKYSFSGDILGDMTLYAGWYAHSGSAYESYSMGTPYSYYSSSSYYSISNGSTSADTYVYLIANETGSHTIHYRNGSSGSSYGSYIGITNITTNTTIKAMNVCESTSYSSVTFDCNVGDIILINVRASNYSSNVRFYFEGFASVSSTASVPQTSYSATFNDTMSVTYGSSFTLPTPTRTGYTFGGWTTSDGTPVTDGTWSATSDLALTAIWTANTNTITFDTNGGTLDSTTMTVTYDQAYNLPEPTRTGYTFNGWYDSNGERVVNGEWNRTSDVALTAHWTANSYTVTLGNSASDDSVTVTLNPNYTGSNTTTVTLVNGQTFDYPEVPTRDGYQFAGWYLDSACTMVYSFTGDITSDFTLYAAWSNVSITNDTNYPWEIVDGVLRSTNHYHSSSSYYVITAVAPVTVNFTCWSDSEGGCDYLTVYLNNSNYATVYGNQGTYTYSISLNTGDYITFRYSKDGSVHTGTDRAYISGISFLPGATQTSTAVVNNPVSYSQGSTATYSVTYGSSFALPTPTREGYTFSGWYDANNNPVVNGTWNYTSDMTLTPGWTPATYNITFADTMQGATVTYDYNYESLSDYRVTLSAGEYLIYPSVPTRNGYIFTGWYTDSACTSRYDFSGNITGNMTLYAGWVATSSDYNTKNIIDPTQYTSSSNYYSKIVNAHSLTSPDYLYLVANESGTHTIYFRCSTSGTYYSSYIGITNVTTGEVIRTSARYASSTYDCVSFDCNAGDIIVIDLYYYYYSGYSVRFYFDGFDSITSTATPVSMAYSSGSTATQSVTYTGSYTLPTPIREGYTFNGWYDESGNRVYNGTWNYTSNMTLTAHWVANH